MFDFLLETRHWMVCHYNQKLSITYDVYLERLMEYIKERAKFEGMELRRERSGQLYLEYVKGIHVVTKYIGMEEELMHKYNMYYMKDGHNELMSEDFTRKYIDQFYEKCLIKQGEIYQNTKEVLDSVIREVKRTMFEELKKRR